LAFYFLDSIEVRTALGGSIWYFSSRDVIGGTLLCFFLALPIVPLGIMYVQM
jgi:hypothetical protein